MRAVERGDGWLRVGPLLFTTWRTYKRRERIGFEFGVECQRMGLLEGGSAGS